MDTGYTDALAATGLLLFTGADISATDNIIEVISKLGVVGVLWYWLKDMKEQMKLLLETFDTETNEIREHYGKLIDDMKEEHVDYKNRIDKQLKHRTTEVGNLNNKIYELTKSKLDN